MNCLLFLFKIVDKKYISYQLTINFLKNSLSLLFQTNKNIIKLVLCGFFIVLFLFYNRKRVFIILPYDTSMISLFFHLFIFIKKTTLYSQETNILENFSEILKYPPELLDFNFFIFLSYNIPMYINSL